MATSIAVRRTTPHSAVFQITTTDSSPAYFQKSGAVGNDHKDLSSLNAGPLKAFLAGLANWTDTALAARLRFRRLIGDSASYTTPVVGSQEVDVSWGQSNQGPGGSIPGLQFTPQGATLAIIEITLIHSAQR